MKTKVLEMLSSLYMRWTEFWKAKGHIIKVVGACLGVVCWIVVMGDLAGRLFLDNLDRQEIRCEVEYASPAADDKTHRSSRHSSDNFVIVHTTSCGRVLVERLPKRFATPEELAASFNPALKS
ncbi:hypothetical protein NMP99_01315 [Glutamicibacter mishrai]|uniref:hypothetical protein n=1 Tax=Glutamicibacter mishrai TaxID=1775880 RepID=UPI0020CD3DE7|nr:hypothetical protein [Glutamicibacter mishrai]UTT39978.1 hypothetical protein NMP99_01315 [Glutamicibacter mishrai]